MKTASQFYNELGVDKLAARKTELQTKKELSYLKKYILKKQRILDLACGYGRFTIPLFREGYDIQGVDISKNFIEKAMSAAKNEKLNIIFKVADIRKLPYEKNSFDSVICMWSAFNELRTKRDQIKSLKEILRVLNNSGVAFLEMPQYTKMKLLNSEVESIKNNLVSGKIDGIAYNPHYIHTRKTLFNLMKELKIYKYKIFIDNFGGRKRLLLIFWK